MLEKFFKLKQSATTVRTEVIAGVTTFIAMAYILIVNPDIVSQGNSQIFNGVFFGTCIAAAIGTLLMGFLANLPFAQAPGMGLNAYFAFTVMPMMGALASKPEMSITEQYQSALSIVFISGILFILITVLGMREAIVKAIPKNIKIAISGGIGLFLAYLGLQSAKLVVPNEATQVSLIDFSQVNSTDPNVRNMVFGAIIAVIGLIIISVLYKLKVKGSILIGVVVSAILCYFPFGIAKFPESFNFNIAERASDFAQVSFFKLDFATIFSGGDIFKTISTVLMMILAFSLVDMFDTIGSLLGTAKNANLLDENGEMPEMKKALLSDSIATTSGALLGTPTVTTYVESSAGIAEGGRTGLTAVTTGVLFLLAILLAPVISLVPAVATAPALIFVGGLMISGVKDLNFSDISESIPAFLTIALMPLTYSIANGIAFGLFSYVMIKLLTGKIKETNWVTWLLAILFVLRYFIAI